MSYILLTGAGFTANWGGWLANEAFEYLLGNSQITPLISAQLWKAKEAGTGFEGALDLLRMLCQVQNDEEHAIALGTFEGMLASMFYSMNSSFSTIQFEPDTTVAIAGEHLAFVRNFLCRFDKIFTLNQDTLLEQHYRDSDFLAGSHGRWFGLDTPGLQEMKFNGGPYASPGLYTPAPPPFKIIERKQPYFKLHGSSNWQGVDGGRLLIMGGNKSANIAASGLLSWYEEEFHNALIEKGARLMVIGYSFSDIHINYHIRAGSDAGLKLFIVDPRGVDAIDTLQASGRYSFGASLQQSLVGASRRNILTTLARDTVERAKIMRFFSN